MFGEDSQAIKDGRIVTVQALSGTGSLRIGFEFLHEWIPSKVYVSNPTWANHHNIIKKSGLSFVEYPYYDPKTHKALINKFIDTLSQAQHGNLSSCTYVLIIPLV
jgi:aspartate aminotransferase